MGCGSVRRGNLQRRLGRHGIRRGSDIRSHIRCGSGGRAVIRRAGIGGLRRRRGIRGRSFRGRSFRGYGVGHGSRLDRRHRRRRAAVHAIAQGAQDRGEVLAGRAGQRGHRLGDDEAAAVERAGRLLAGTAVAPGQRRPDQIGKALEDIDAHRALAALAIAQHAIGIPVERLVDGEGRPPAARQLLRARQCRQVDIVLLVRPQQRRDRARGRLQQRRNIDVIGAEAHAVFAQGGARGLVQFLDVVGDLRPFQHAEPLGQLEGDAARDAGDILGLGKLEQRAEQFLDMGLEPEVEPRLHRLARGSGQPVVGDDARPRTQHLVGGDELGHRVAGPAQRAVGGEHELIVRRIRQLFRARLDLAGKRLLRRRLQRPGLRAGLRRIGREHESVEAADGMALHDHFARLANFRVQHGVFPQAAHQYTGPAINETLS